MGSPLGWGLGSPFWEGWGVLSLVFIGKTAILGVGVGCAGGGRWGGGVKLVAPTWEVGELPPNQG